MSLPRNLSEQIAGRVRDNVSLAGYTTLEIGGAARWLLEVSTEEQLLLAWQTGADKDLPVLLLGGGSNVLVDDAGFPGLVILNRAASLIMDRLSDGRYLLRCGSGLVLHDLVTKTIGMGMAGLESLAGIPGTVGGAVCGNAGAYGKNIGSRVRQALVSAAPGRKPVWVSRAGMDFTYRSSKVKTDGGLIVAVEIVLEPGNAVKLATRAQEIMEYRWAKLPRSHSAGSYFKNLPPENPGENRRGAGLFLDRAGAKGLRIGDAAVYEKHANIIINLGQATSRDVIALAAKMKSLVADRFGIVLEEEVRYIGSETP